MAKNKKGSKIAKKVMRKLKTGKSSPRTKKKK